MIQMLLNKAALSAACAVEVQASPDESGSHIGATIGVHSVQDIIEAYLAALPDEGGLVERLRQYSEIMGEADDQRLQGMLELMGEAADALEGARATPAAELLSRNDVGLLVAALEHSLRFSRLPKFQRVELEARLQQCRAKLAAAPERSSSNSHE